MPGVLVEFVGGPCDGERRVVRAEDPMDPPLRLVVAGLVGSRPDVIEIDYIRKPNPSPYGPLWHYSYVPPPSRGSGTS